MIRVVGRIIRILTILYRMIRPVERMISPVCVRIFGRMIRILPYETYDTYCERMIRVVGRIIRILTVLYHMIRPVERILAACYRMMSYGNAVCRNQERKASLCVPETENPGHSSWTRASRPRQTSRAGRSVTQLCLYRGDVCLPISPSSDTFLTTQTTARLWTLQESRVRVLAPWQLARVLARRRG